MPPTFLGLQELFIIIVVIAVTLFALIAAGVLYLRRIKPQAVVLEAIKIQELISLVISILYFFTVCVTLILLIVQNRNIAMQTQFALQSLEGNVYGQVMSQTLCQDELFIKNPETRPYFYESKELSPDDPLSYKVLATAEYLLDFYDSLEKQLKHYPHLWIHEQKTWEANIIDMFAYSPVLCRYLDTTKEWYSDSLYVLKTAGEKKRHQGFSKQKYSGN
jgi:ABC-type multidrug transport system fused ATPase/permease subunit